jgi:hypothetical protein
LRRSCSHINNLLLSLLPCRNGKYVHTMKLDRRGPNISQELLFDLRELRRYYHT